MTTNPASSAAGNGHNQGGNAEAGDSPAAPEVAIPIAEDDEILRDSSHAEAKSRAEGAAGGPIFRRLSRKLTRPDSLDVESMRVRGMDNAAQVSAQNKTFTDIENISSIVKELVGRVAWAGVNSLTNVGKFVVQNPSTSQVLQLAFQSIGVVYGDLGTSPLYVYSSTFTKGIKSNLDVLGVLSLIIYTIVAIPLIKYIFIVLRANDNGEGRAAAPASFLVQIQISVVCFFLFLLFLFV